METRQITLAEQDILPQIPLDILRNDHPLDIRVYIEAAIIDDTKGSKPFELPPREIMARQCGCGIHQLTASYKRLHEAGWLRILNLEAPGKTRRRLVILRYLKPVQMLQVISSEGTEARASKTVVSARQTPQGIVISALHNIYRRHPECLKNVPDEEIRELSGNASPDQVETAFQYLSSYNKPIFNPKKFFAKRFAGGIFVPPSGFEMRTNREEIQQQPVKLPKMDVRANIHATELHTAPEIDFVCKELEDGRAIQKADLPAAALADETIACYFVNDRDHHGFMRLAENAEIFFLKKGEWLVRWRSNQTTSINSHGPKRINAVLEQMSGK